MLGPIRSICSRAVWMVGGAMEAPTHLDQDARPKAEQKTHEGGSMTTWAMSRMPIMPTCAMLEPARCSSRMI